jgi:hypothetical protein
VSDATIWRVTLELSIAILEASFLLIYDDYSTDVASDDHQFIGDDISIKSANVKLNINDVCNLLSVSSEHFN